MGFGLRFTSFNSFSFSLNVLSFSFNSVVVALNFANVSFNFAAVCSFCSFSFACFSFFLLQPWMTHCPKTKMMIPRISVGCGVGLESSPSVWSREVWGEL